MASSALDKIDQLNKQAWDIRITDSNKAQPLSREAFELSEKSDYIKGRAESLRTLGFCFIRVSNFDEALTCLNKSLSLFVSLNDFRGQSDVYEYLGIIHRSWGHFALSLETLFKALDLSLQTGYEEGESTTIYQIGVTYKHLGNFEKALENLYKSLALAKSIKYILLEGYNLNVIGTIYFDAGDYEKALEYYQKGLMIRRASGDKWGEAGSLDNIGSTFLKLGDWGQAEIFCNQSLAINRSTGDKKGQANALLHLAEIYKAAGNLKKAAGCAKESLDIREANLDRKGQGEVLLFLAGVRKLNLKKDKKAGPPEELFQALKIAVEIKATDLLAKAHLALYETYKDAGDYGASLGQLELHFAIEKDLQRDAVRQKVENLEISYRAEEAAKESELFRLRNVELANLYEETNRQKTAIEEQKKNVELALAELKVAQAQLIHSEKMASLGELTAGIAHEIQNPLNFVNNFSEVCAELAAEMENAVIRSDREEINSITTDLKTNLQKITHHGKRADAIVKGMLLHSGVSTGIKKPTDLNALVDEYLRLSYHGLRAKDKTFNATINTAYDEGIGNVDLIPQDIGRVMLNLFTNAFYAISEKKKFDLPGYEPTVSVSTKKAAAKVEVMVTDNGSGIPQKVLDKIFQPFFTTKPPGQGTGLGLSLSYDIIRAHGGELRAENRAGEGAAFIIFLPINI